MAYWTLALWLYARRNNMFCWELMHRLELVLLRKLLLLHWYLLWRLLQRSNMPDNENAKLSIGIITSDFASEWVIAWFFFVLDVIISCVDSWREIMALSLFKDYFRVRNFFCRLIRVNWLVIQSNDQHLMWYFFMISDVFAYLHGISSSIRRLNNNFCAIFYKSFDHWWWKWSSTFPDKNNNNLIGPIKVNKINSPYWLILTSNCNNIPCLRVQEKQLIER